MNERKIAISGATGFIGTYLTTFFSARNYHVIPLHRELFEGDKKEQLKTILSTCDVVINLAGAPILHLWAKSYKKKIKDSRIHITRCLVTAINELPVKPDLLISASAVGFYPSHGSYDESYVGASNTFLSQVCKEWEHEAKLVSQKVRIAICRFGIVLSPGGGAFKQMTLLSQKEIATILAPGTQAFPWISLPDLARAMDFMIQNEKESGIYNFTTPETISYEDFIRQVADKNKSLLTITIPAFLLKMMLGEAASFITGTSYVYPGHLIKQNFSYTYPTIDTFLNSL
ncbi:MAG: TIGR01777 family oxidoreductase [Tannerellaceae bacterium]|nr:TIGR01777 family oxidoreductase [Tannerellaceae bacterium]